MTNWYVQVVKKRTGEVVKQYGPMIEHKADKLNDGLLDRIDWDEYFTLVLPEEEVNE
jgi:hypothetical protein